MIANRTGGIGAAVTAANFRNFVLEVGIKQRYAGIQVIVVIPEQGELFAQALLWFQIRVANDDTVKTAATRYLAPAGRRLTQIRRTLASRNPAF